MLSLDKAEQSSGGLADACRQSHPCRYADAYAADDAEDLPADFGRHGLLGDAMDQRITRHGGGNGEDKRDDQADGGRADRSPRTAPSGCRRRRRRRTARPAPRRSSPSRSDRRIARLSGRARRAAHRWRAGNRCEYRVCCRNAEAPTKLVPPIIFSRVTWRSRRPWSLPPRPEPIPGTSGSTRCRKSRRVSPYRKKIQAAPR